MESSAFLILNMYLSSDYHLVTLILLLVHLGEFVNILKAQLATLLHILYLDCCEKWLDRPNVAFKPDCHRIWANLNPSAYEIETLELFFFFNLTLGCLTGYVVALKCGLIPGSPDWITGHLASSMDHCWLVSLLSRGNYLSNRAVFKNDQVMVELAF